jgi:hypothetical protein
VRIDWGEPSVATALRDKQDGHRQGPSSSIIDRRLSLRGTSGSERRWPRTIALDELQERRAASLIVAAPARPLSGAGAATVIGEARGGLNRANTCSYAAHCALPFSPRFRTCRRVVASGCGVSARRARRRPRVADQPLGRGSSLPIFPGVCDPLEAEQAWVDAPAPLVALPGRGYAPDAAAPHLSGPPRTTYCGSGGRRAGGRFGNTLGGRCRPATPFVGSSQRPP